MYLYKNVYIFYFLISKLAVLSGDVGCQPAGNGYQAKKVKVVKKDRYS